jgi:hypothetical protein
MKLSAPWLFGAAAAFNFAVGFALLALRPWAGPLLHLDPIAGTNLVLVNLTGGFILLFAYGYARIALDPVGWRPLIGLSAIGKAMAAAAVILPWAMGQISAVLPSLVGGDVVFAGLFAVFLRQGR